ncbi:malonic semialdehyde reductase [Ruania alba]|uniref:3-hydroxypropanoate dehydrogenase n=1 Tax=Ruania alba TaxID=648782 RepID=A0A1H5CV16_9MICO|nr:malonic semialdehyde reductase [Ruania alba]SED70519.1 3-hydroxypropanoate dehydrogenase [Ruania alba]
MSIDTAADRPALHLARDSADLLFREARSVREFSDAEVPDETIAAVYDLIKWGPTAMNCSPMRLLLVRSAEARERLCPHMAEGNRERVAEAPLSIVVAFDPVFYERLDHLVPHVPGIGEKVGGDAAAAEAMARTNALLQAGYLIVGLRAAGLATGPMNGMDAEGIDAEFFAESGWRSFMVINVSQRDGASTTRPRAPRLEFADAAMTV